MFYERDNFDCDFAPLKCFKTVEFVRVRAPLGNKDRLFVWPADGESTQKYPRGLN